MDRERLVSEHQMVNVLEFSVEKLLDDGVTPNMILEIVEAAVQVAEDGESNAGAAEQSIVDSYAEELGFRTDSIRDLFLAVKNFPDITQILIHSLLVPPQLELRHRLAKKAQ